VTRAARACARAVRRAPTAGPRTRGGFTLIELLVSVFLLSVLSAFCYGTLSYVGKSREGTEAAFERLRGLQLAVHTLVTDLAQLEPRPVRDPLGNIVLPALQSDRRTTEIVSLTRGGWSNTAGLPRGTLQRVTYVLDGDRLIRRYTTVLDATLANAFVERELLKDVVAVQFRFMDQNRQWVDQWPPLVATAGGTPAGQSLRPIAVEVTLELRDVGRIVRLVEVPG
jgi:general secretion pathway protein J